MTELPAPSEHDHSSVSHVVPMKILIAVFLALVVLTVVTVGVARIDLGNLNLYVALAVAGLKASLVVLFFMHLFWDRRFNAIVFLGCLIFVTIFISLSLTDTSANNKTVVQDQVKAMETVHKLFQAPPSK